MNRIKDYFLQAIIPTLITLYMLKYVSPNMIPKLILWTGDEQMGNKLALIIPFVSGFVVFILLVIIFQVLYRLEKSSK